MPTKKKLTPQEEQSVTAQAMRTAYHSERGNEEPKDWDELSPEKQQRWLDKAVGNED